jgi:hypothetical protein
MNIFLDLQILFEVYVISHIYDTTQTVLLCAPYWYFDTHVLLYMSLKEALRYTRLVVSTGSGQIILLILIILY